MTAIKAGLEFGHNSLNKNTVPYVRILRSSLGLVREFYSSSSTEPRPFQRLLMVNVMEFHIQVLSRILKMDGIRRLTFAVSP